MQKLLSTVLRFIFKAVLAVFGLVFAFSLLAVALVMLLVGLLRWAVTGKKPAPVVAFSQFKQFRSAQFKPFSKEPDARPGDVVDVEVRDVTPQKSTSEQRTSDTKLRP